MQEEEHINDILFRYLTGEANSEDKALVEKWLKGEGSEEELEALKARLQRLGEFRGNSTNVNTEAAWKRVSDRLKFGNHKPETKVIPLYAKIPMAMRYAAAIIVLIGAYFFFKPTNDLDKPFLAAEPTKNHITFASNEGVEKLNLSDGSKVTLRENAVLRYPESMDDSIRLVHLEQGEVFFEVKRDEKRPFIIQSKNSLVKVLGTAFTVQIIEDDAIQVSVTEGIVRLYGDTLLSESTKHIDLIKGQIGKRTDKGLFRLESGSWNAISWLTGNLRFNNEDMTNVIADLEDHYQVEIKVEEQSFLNCRLTAKYKKKEIEDVLESLKLTFDIEVTHIEDRITIKGKGC